MASIFQIISNKDKDNLYLELSGNFDEYSAHDLINTLKKYDTGFEEITIDTTNIKTVHPFGRDVFQTKLNGINRQLKNLIFVGPNLHKIAPNQEDC